MSKLILKIVSPQNLEFFEEVDSVIVPGSEGELGILPGHADLATTLRSGNVRFTKNQNTTDLSIQGGFLEISKNEVSILSD